MSKKKPSLVNTRRIYLIPPSPTPPGWPKPPKKEPSEPPYPWPQEPRPPRYYPWAPDLPGEYIPPGGYIPYEPPEIGDPVETEGYIDFLRIDEKGYSAGLDSHYTDATSWANYWLELKTYCVVGISRDIDKSTNIKEYRGLYTDSKGEELAVSMAVIATLKDAFLNRSRVRLNGIRSELEVQLGIPGAAIFTSDQYYNIKSVTLLRS